jgi:hypothetical protein
MVHLDNGKTADVHPDEVVNWHKAGWRPASELPAPAPKIVLPPPPVAKPTPVDPLAALPKNWEQSEPTRRLRDLAAAVSGRTPEDRAQAIAIIKEQMVTK